MNHMPRIPVGSSMILPLDHPEPFAATLGIMLYPGTDDSDRRRAAALASHWLAEPIKRATADGHEISGEVLLRIAVDAGDRLDDLDRRWRAGQWTGELVKAYFALCQSRPELASWENAERILEIAATRDGNSGSRSSFKEARSSCISVAHLWGAWMIREETFREIPGIGFRFQDDVDCFLAESEILRDWGQTWRQKRAKAEPPFAGVMWRVPDGWRPPVAREGWPEPRIAFMTLPEDLLAGLKPAGRPSGK